MISRTIYPCSTIPSFIPRIETAHTVLKSTVYWLKTGPNWGICPHHTLLSIQKLNIRNISIRLQLFSPSYLKKLLQVTTKNHKKIPIEKRFRFTFHPVKYSLCPNKKIIFGSLKTKFDLVELNLKQQKVIIPR